MASFGCAKAHRVGSEQPTTFDPPEALVWELTDDLNRWTDDEELFDMDPIDHRERGKDVNYTAILLRRAADAPEGF